MENCPHGIRITWCALCNFGSPPTAPKGHILVGGRCALCDLGSGPWCSACQRAAREELEAPSKRLGHTVTSSMVENLLRRKTAMRRQTAARRARSVLKGVAAQVQALQAVYVCSPLRANTEVERARNIEYARAVTLDSERRGEAPFTPHLLYTQIFDDNVQEERERAMKAAIVWFSRADKVVVYTDLGISQGMREEMVLAVAQRRMVEERTLPGWVVDREEVAGAQVGDDAEVHGGSR